jgi:hypothetical protein
MVVDYKLMAFVNGTRYVLHGHEWNTNSFRIQYLGGFSTQDFLSRFIDNHKVAYGLCTGR